MATMRDPDILFGKLALGRGLLARDDAQAIARELAHASAAGRGESFAATAVRLGYLDPQQVRRLSEDLARGELVCRGRCGRRVPVAAASPRDAGPCPACGGAVYLARGVPASLASLEAGPTPGKTGLTVLELDVPVIQPPEPASDSSTYTANGTKVVRPLGPAAAPRPSPTALAQEEPGPRSGTEPLLDALPIPLPPEPGESAERTQLMEGDDQVLPLPGFEPFQLAPGLRVVAPIGKGGTGTVYRAIDAAGRVVAVKVLRATADAEALKRFDREVRISALLDHPQIVKVLQTGTVPPPHLDADKPWCSMEYVQGRDLTAWLAEGPRSPEACARLILCLCDPVEHAHGKGVVHRDIKPGNVLVRTSDELPVLCDFGLARYRSRDQSLLTEQGDILGTPAFMSPEQARGNQAQIGPPTDVHALGAVLYRMVTGRPPFQGPTPFSTIEAVVRARPIPPRQVAPGVSQGLEAVILKALAKEPRERYHTASRLKAALLQVLG